MRSKPFRVIVTLALAGSFVAGTSTQVLAQQRPNQQGQNQQEPAQQEPNATEEDATSTQASQGEKAGDQADVDARYRALTRQAAKAYGDQEYTRALELFEEAYKLKPVPNLRYNMGRIEEKRGNFEAAMAHYEKFVTLAGVDIKARQDALDRVKTLREVVALRKEGEEVDDSKLDEQNEDRALASPSQADGSKAATANIERDYTAAWVTMGLALASYGTSGFFALQTRQANTDFENATTRAARRSAAASGETSAIIADSALALGVVMTGVSVYFFLSPSETEVAPEQTTMQLAPQIGPDRAGMTFSVEF